MNKRDLTDLIHFNFWANERILATCEQLTSEQFVAAVSPDPGWGSLRGILVHALDTELGWRSVLQASEDDMILDAVDFPDVGSLKTRWQAEKADWFTYLETLSDEQLNHGYGDDPLTSPHVWQTIMHVFTHGIQHRSEAALILTGYGHSPGELDFDVFMRETSE